MTRQQKIFWGKTVVILGVIPVVIFAYAGGPDVGKSGTPNESTCAEAGCHIGNLNTGTGSVAVTFAGGQSYTPGARQRLTVTVSDPNARRWGFQMTARRASDARAQAGTFASTDASTTIGCASTNLVQTTYDIATCPQNQPLMYINHANPRQGTGSGTFEVDWTPPDSDVGNITIYVAGNAANGDGTNTGDRIYTRTYTLTPAAGGGGGGPKPVISQNEVTNGASFRPGITAGSWVTIKGTNLASSTTGVEWTIGSDGRLPTTLNNVSVTINGRPAYVQFVRNDQINVLAPADTNLGPVNVVVTNNGVASDVATVQLQQYSPAFFQYNGTWAVATTPDFRVIGDPSRVPGTVPARPGDVIVLWGTGFGATNPASPDGSLPTPGRPLATAPTVQIGGSAAAYQGGAISAFAGLYQIAVTVPNVADGDQRVVASVGGFSSPDNITIYVRR